MGYLDKDGLEKLVDCIKRYVQAKLAKCLPKSGGTIDGNLTVSGTITVTGAVNGVTPTAGDNSTKLATTAFVQGELGKSLKQAVFVDSYSGSSNLTFSVNLPGNGLYYLIICTAADNDASNTQSGICVVDTTTALCFKAMGGISFAQGYPSLSGTTVSVKLSNMTSKTAYVYYMRIGDGANPS